MLIFVKLFGIFMLGMGIFFVFSPKKLKAYNAFCRQGKRIYIEAIIKLVIGVIFLLAASQARLVGVIVAIGILSLIKAILVFILGLEKMKSTYNWLSKRSLFFVRLMGLVALAFGALIVYSA